MKRKVVQHGPSTLTLSLPAKWVKEHGIQRGNEINVELHNKSLLLTAEKGVQFERKQLDLIGGKEIVSKIVASLYKQGCDEIILTYTTTEQLESIHKIIESGCIGYEIARETKSEVLIKRVSEPAQEEFKTMFRRIFYFLLSIADEGLEATRRRNVEELQRLVLRDKNVNKLTDFCRRVVNKFGQSDYKSDTALYHILEQLEKIGDHYKELHQNVIEMDENVDERLLTAYAEVNALIKLYEEVFFQFSIENINLLLERSKTTLQSFPSISSQYQIKYPLMSIAKEIHNLIGATMILYL